MRYCVQPATAEDVALLAIAMNDDEATPSERGVDESGDQLVHAFVSSTHVWAARDRENQPCALWGVGPASPDQEVGQAIIRYPDFRLARANLFGQPHPH